MSDNQLLTPPLRVSRPYEPIGRRLLSVVSPQPPLPPESGIDPYESQFVYYRDVCGRAFVSAHRDSPKVRFIDSNVASPGDLPSVFDTEGDLEGVEHLSQHHLVDPEEVFIPRYEIFSAPYVKKKDIDRLPFPILQNARTRALDAIQRQEDVEILKCINAAVCMDHSTPIYGIIQPENLLLLLNLIEEHELDPEYMVIHPQRLKDFRGWGSVDGLVLHTRAERRATGIAGTFYDAKILCSTMCPKNAIYVLAAPEYVGYLVEEEELSTRAVRYANGDEGAFLSEKIGIAVLNDYAIARAIIISNSYNEFGRINTPMTMRELAKSDDSDIESNAEPDAVGQEEGEAIDLT